MLMEIYYVTVMHAKLLDSLCGVVNDFTTINFSLRIFTTI